MDEDNIDFGFSGRIDLGDLKPLDLVEIYRGALARHRVSCLKVEYSSRKVEMQELRTMLLSYFDAAPFEDLGAGPGAASSNSPAGLSGYLEPCAADDVQDTQ